MDVAIDPNQVDPAKFAEVVSAASDAELQAIIDDPGARGVLLDTIFKQMEDRVRPERTKGVREVVHWKITGRPGGGDDTYQVVIDDGTAKVGKELNATPRVTMEVEPISFLRMIAGQTNGMKLVLTRKLKIKGDMMFAPRIEQMFRTDPVG